MSTHLPLSADVVVLGAGAGGLMAACEAGRRGLSVLVIDGNPGPGAKILISGGGRCNFTNRTVTAANFVSQNPHFARSALARYTPQHFIQRVEAAGIEYYEKTLGQLFCEGTGSARRIVELLMADATNAGVRFAFGARVHRISGHAPFLIELENASLSARSVIVATGGLSIPKLGASDLAFQIASQYQIKVVPPRPALVPFTLDFAADARFADLAGISVPAEVTAGSGRFVESMLFTHKGLSGPAVLQASLYWQDGQPVQLRFLPDDDIAARMIMAKSAQPKASLRTVIGQMFSQRLADRLMEQLGPDAASAAPLGQMNNRRLSDIAAQLGQHRCTPNGTEGYLKAEVTAGGIDTDALSSRTMMAKAVPNLHFIGECVDVTGWLGGYNFQWAWASGHAAGTEVLQH